MNIIKWISIYWLDILLIGILCAGFAVYLGKKISKWHTLTSDQQKEQILQVLENLLPIALGLVTAAESMYGGGTGKIKRAFVIDGLYQRIPDVFKMFITEDMLDQILTKALAEAKILWETNVKIKTMIEER